MDFLIGADPELFVRQGGQLTSAYGMIPGTKKNPYKVEKGAVQVDGMALEFNIDPAKNSKEFLYNINKVLANLKDMIPKDCDFSEQSAVNFTNEVLKNQVPAALRLGCDPDFNAWNNGKQNPVPKPRTKGFRTASGHLHIGWTKNTNPLSAAHIDACIRATKQLDYSLGLASLILDRTGSKRRDLYGRAGAFRPKEYGVEYRVLSNFWIMDDDYKRFVYRMTLKAMTDLLEGCEYEDKSHNFLEDASEIINSDDIFSAQYILDNLGLTDMVSEYAK